MHSLYKELSEKDGLKPMFFRFFVRTVITYLIQQKKIYPCNTKLKINFQAHMARKDDFYAVKISDKESAINDKHFLGCT